MAKWTRGAFFSAQRPLRHHLHQSASPCVCECEWVCGTQTGNRIYSHVCIWYALYLFLNQQTSPSQHNTLKPMHWWGGTDGTEYRFRSLKQFIKHTRLSHTTGTEKQHQDRVTCEEKSNIYLYNNNNNDYYKYSPMLLLLFILDYR